jgi:phage gpG-like protein
MPSVAMQMNVAFEDLALRDMYSRMAGFGQGPLDRMDDAIGGYGVSSTALRFRNQIDPLGNPWKPSRRALKEHGKTLIDKGLLLASLTYNVLAGKGVEWGSPLIYASAQQNGAEITIYPRSQQIYRRLRGNMLEPRFAKKSQANFASWATIAHTYTIHIPPRPFLGVNDDDGQEIEDIAARHLSATILGASVTALLQ